MRPRSQWVYKTVKIYIYILHVTEFAKYIIPVPDSIYTVRHILAFGVKRIFCSREGRFANHRTLTNQASGFYCRCSGSTLRRFYLHCCTTSCKLHLSCFIAELVSQPRFPKYLKRWKDETHNKTDGYIIVKWTLIYNIRTIQNHWMASLIVTNYHWMWPISEDTQVVIRPLID